MNICTGCLNVRQLKYSFDFFSIGVWLEGKNQCFDTDKEHYSVSTS